MKTNELIGPALDWAVAKATLPPDRTPEPSFVDLCVRRNFCPSEAWEQGGPIIERIKGFQFKQWLESRPESCCEVHIHNYEGDWIQFGPTPLIAAMRCYVASKLGDEVEVPAELLGD